MSKSTISTFQLFELFPDEESAREGNVQRHTFERLDSLIDAVVGKRITYKQVIA